MKERNNKKMKEKKEEEERKKKRNGALDFEWKLLINRDNEW